MTADVIARAILAAGALLLVVGPGMQARLEMFEFHELLEALTETGPPAATQEYLRLLAVGPSMALRSPLGLLEFLIKSPADWYPRYRAARRAFAASGDGHDARVVEIRTHLTKARNWSIVVLGSVLIFTGASVELTHTLITGRAQ
jgi:hypothetical protein